MRAEQILQRSFQGDLEGVHLARIRLVFVAVYTLLRTGKLSLTSLGRAIAGVSPKHGIKKIDRLLGNPRVHAERIEFYRAIARRLIAPGSRPVLIIDWTAVTTQLWALVAAVSYEGRALIIYSVSRWPTSEWLAASPVRAASASFGRTSKTGSNASHSSRTTRWRRASLLRI